jgi:hypothetical protein
MIRMPPRPLEVDPTKPLQNEKHEQFARLRALLVPRLIAAREAGYDEMTAGNAAKLDRRKDIRARVAILAGMDEQMIRDKRARIEARLMAVMESDLLRDFAIIEMRPHGEDGKQIGEIVGIDWAAVRASDSSAIVSKFKFDPKTGRLVDFERDDVLAAIAQLRDMYGFKSVAKVALTDPTGEKGVPLVPEYTDEQRVRAFELFLARHAATSNNLLKAAPAAVDGGGDHGA